MWQPQTAALAEHFRVVRFDHPGHGGSPTEPAPRTIADLGARVLSLLDDAAIGRVSYVGLSLGGMVGMWLAAHAPQRIDRLALLCTSAQLGPPEYWHLRAEAVTAQGMDTIVDSVPVRWFTPAFRSGHPAVYEGYRDMLRSSKPDGYAACCEVIAAMDLRADLRRIQADTLVIAGADDEAIPVTHAAAIAEAIPRSRLEVVSDAAHLANVEQPAQITELLLDHLLDQPAEAMA
jgi:3-oxoadipate enol-lactonase